MQQMMYGNRGENSPTGAPFSRDGGAGSHDDAEGRFPLGFGWLVRLAAWSERERTPYPELRTCGEHRGEFDFVAFFRMAGVDYLSCSLLRVPTSRVVAVRGAVSSSRTPAS